MADLAAAETSCEEAVTGKTYKDQARVWQMWQEWGESVGIIDDIFPVHFTKHQRIKLIGTFVMALHGGHFLGPAYDKLAAGTI